MDRSSFLKGLLATGSLSILPFNPPKQYQKIHLLQTFVAGFRYYKGKEVLQALIQPYPKRILKK